MLKLDGTELVTFEQDYYPSFCGGTILHDFSFSDYWHGLSTKDRRTVSRYLAQLLRARTWKVESPLGTLEIEVEYSPSYHFASVRDTHLAMLLSSRSFKKGPEFKNSNSGNWVRTVQLITTTTRGK